MRLLAALVLLLTAAPAAAQGFTDEEKAQGYALRGDTTVFVFDPARYGVQPDRVVVTGAFRGWSQDMEDRAWHLLSLSSQPIWILPVPNPDYGIVGPAIPFKFRVDDARGRGRWLDPPAGTANAQGGNLVFLFGVTPPRVRAELRGPRAVWVEVAGDDLTRPLDASAYRLVRADGSEIPIAAVLPYEAESAVVVPAEDLDTRRVHFVEVDAGRSRPLRAFASFDGIWRTLYSDKPLGATLGDEGNRNTPIRYRTEIRLFAPRADSVRVFLYPDRTGPSSASRALVRDGDGVWETTFNEDLHGTWYDFAVYGPDDPGNAFTNHTGRRVTDPYALVSDDSWGRARIWRDHFAPPPPVRGGRPAMEDLISYEVHVQDFTDNLPVADDLRGTIPAFGMPGLRNRRGEPVGLDHLVELGVNAVHLLPVQEFFHYPDSVWQAAFADDPFMQQQGVSEENYQWGYRITHFFAVEGRYRQRGTEPGAERQQFRDLVATLHERGIAVLVDFVFNHTGENMEGADRGFNFSGIDRRYYYRTDEAGDFIGPYGNEIRSEGRPMVQRWLLDQMRHYLDVFGVDGFRIDLAGQTDEQTLRWLRAELGPDVLIYGEPWIDISDPDARANPDWAWYKVDAPITFFQDDARNAFKGPVSTPRDPIADRGFAGGHGEMRERAKLGLTNAWPEEASPNAGINYLDIHDNWALADQFALHTAGPHAWDGRHGVDEGGIRIAAALLFTSLGPVVLHGGTEILRSKGVAPHPDSLPGGAEWVRETALGPIYIKGRGDTYNLRAANRYDWEGDSLFYDPAVRRRMFAWWRGLIRFRRSEAGEVFRRGEPVPEGYYRFFEPADPRTLGYLVDGRVLVLLNAGTEPVTFEGVDLPAGRWRVVADGEQVDADGTRGLGRALAGGRTHALAVAPKSALIWALER
ncbi:MAG TPA: alpha-amylase family glycosyl hydrolase [Rubricoccaceae bacterium]|nr:alpha-amylase family glycosyl hydrolase [Rubricoccaceae bacterium]